MTLLKKIQMERIASKNIKRTLLNRNANKTAVLFRKSNSVFIVG